MGDSKIFAQNEKDLEILIQTTSIYSRDIGIKFGIENLIF